MDLKIARLLLNTPTAHSTPASAPGKYYPIPNQSVLASARISLTLPQSCNQPGSPTETDLSKLIVDAAIEAGVRNFICGSFADSMALTNGTVYCRMMMQRAKTLEYARSRKSEFSSIVSVDAGWFSEGLLMPEYAAAMGGFPFSAHEEGYLTLKVPKWGKDNAFIAVAED
jgi:hypothetical protein